MLNSNTNPISFFLDSVRNLKFMLFKYISLRGISNIALALFPYFYKLLLDNLIIGDKNSVVFYLSIISVILIGGNIMSHIAGNILTKLWGLAEKQAFLDVFNFLSKHDAKYFANSIAGKLNSDFMNFRLSISSSMLLLANMDNLIPFITSMVLIFIFNYQIGFLMLFFIVLKITFSKRSFKFVEDLQFKNAKFQSLAIGRIADSIANFTNIKLFNLQKYENQEIYKRLNKYLKIDIKRKFAENNKSSFLTFLFNVFQIAVYYLIFTFYFQNKISLGDAVLFITAINTIKQNLDFLISFFKSYYDDYGTLKNSLNSIIKEQGDLDPINAQNLNVENPSITFKNLNFKYENKLIFRNFNLHIKAGEKLGIVGSSGAGKSTLLAILTAEYKVDAKQYFLDEVDVTKLKLSEIRKNFSVVSQDTQLFNASIKDNLTLYSKYSKKALTAALKKAHLYKFIQSLPDKDETMVGERGVKLSGGQKQRLGIARSILYNAPILILDEATSALDSKTEKDIQESLELAMQNKTVIAVAHRLSTLSNMDRIVVLEKGKIIEEGTHKELLSMKGKYYDLWQHQSKGLI